IGKDGLLTCAWPVTVPSACWTAVKEKVLVCPSPTVILAWPAAVGFPPAAAAEVSKLVSKLVSKATAATNSSHPGNDFPFSNLFIRVSLSLDIPGGKSGGKQIAKEGGCRYSRSVRRLSHF